MKTLRLFLLSLLLLHASFTQASEFSYIFIQGDKKIPIYTKVEGVMMPRYGKNYALLAPLAPGPINIEILFQQNEYPALNFRILVPENGKRAFLLSRKDGKFALYDLEQNFYLQPDNAFEDDHMPAVVTNQSISANNVAVEPEKTSPETASRIPDSEKIYQPESKAEPTSRQSPVTGKQAPQFIESITFNNEEAAGTASKSNSPEERPGVPATGTVTNSDCNRAISEERFIRLRTDINLITNEDQRLGTIQNAIKSNCFSTKQAGELAELLSSDVAKLSALKSFYPKITDQSEFVSLASLISDTEIQSYFLSFLGK